MGTKLIAKSIATSDVMVNTRSISLMPSGGKYVDGTTNAGGSSMNPNVTLGIVIAISIILGAVSGFFLAKRSANK